MTVPKRVGDDLRRRRLALRLRQQDIADALGTTRAYVSAIEGGVEWDPDAEKLVLWDRALGWEDGDILRKLNRLGLPGEVRTSLDPATRDAIVEAVQAGIRDGMAEVLRMLSEEAVPHPDGPVKRVRTSTN